MAIARARTTPRIPLGEYIKGPDAPVRLPPWVRETINFGRRYENYQMRMRLAIELSRQNVLHGTGGPFGAAIFSDGGTLLGVGVNLVVPTHDPTAHGEVTAIRVALGRLGRFSFQEAGVRAALYSSADPCGMCCTATLWAGVTELWCAASRADVESIGFNEGLRPRNWKDQLLRQGKINTYTGFLQPEARAVLDLYREQGGLIYNGRSRRT